jgi:hypothetical protein
MAVSLLVSRREVVATAESLIEQDAGPRCAFTESAARAELDELRCRFWPSEVGRPVAVHGGCRKTSLRAHMQPPFPSHERDGPEAGEAYHTESGRREDHREGGRSEGAPRAGSGNNDRAYCAGTERESERERERERERESLREKPMIRIVTI